MIKQSVQFDEKEYLINQMVLSNPDTPITTITDIINGLDTEWHEYTFDLEVNQEKRIKCTITNPQGQSIRQDKLPILAKEFYWRLIKPYLFM